MDPRENDIMLWQSFLQDDASALGVLFKKYYPQLYQYGNKLSKERGLLEDGIQELFIDLWKNRNPVPSVSVKAYLIKALKFKLMKEIGRNNHQSLDQLHDHLFEIPHEAFIVAMQEQKAMSDQLVKALQQLSGRQREVIYLKFYQELNYDEVSEIMNINYQATRNLLCQALKALRKILSNTSVLKVSV